MQLKTHAQLHNSTGDNCFFFKLLCFSAAIFKLLFSSTCFSAGLARSINASQGSKMIREAPGPQLSDVFFTVQSILHFSC